MEIPRSILERYLKEVQQSDSSQSSISPFYGIWCGAAKTEAEAQKQVKKIRENGFDAQRVCSDAYIKYSGNWQG